MSTDRRNWAGNYSYGAASFAIPENVRQVREAVGSATKARALGTRHSFNSIADTTGVQISLEKLDRIIGIDSRAMTVTAEAGVRYGRLGQFLHERGYALQNLASLPHISIAGACATGTHGSGDGNGNLATAVVGMEIVTADGRIVSVSREDPEFSGMVVHLGALGIVTKLTLKIVPTFEIRQIVYENLPVADLERHFEEIFSSGHSVSLFTNWQGGVVRQVWRKCLLGGEMPEKFFAGNAGAGRSPSDRRVVRGELHGAGRLTGSVARAAAAFSDGFHAQQRGGIAERIFCAARAGGRGDSRVGELRDQITPHLLVSELRTIAADELWMSPCFGRASLGIHFTWKQDWPAVRKVLALIERKLEPFEARPHWGKLFLMERERIEKLYPKFGEFRKLVNKFDRAGKFRNEFLDQFLLA